MGYVTQQNTFPQKIKPEYAIGIPKEQLESFRVEEKNKKHLENMLKAEKIIFAAFSFYGQDYSSARNTRRGEMYKIPRFVSYYVIHDLIPSLSYEQLGGLFSQDRKTVMAAIKSLSDRIETEKEFADIFLKAYTFILKRC